MPSYDAAQFQPPAPVALVTLRSRDGGAFISDVPMLLDTGADVTLIPRMVLQTLDASIVSGSGYELIGFDGHTSFAEVVQIELVFCRRTFRGHFC